MFSYIRADGRLTGVVIFLAAVWLFDVYLWVSGAEIAFLFDTVLLGFALGGTMLCCLLLWAVYRRGEPLRPVWLLLGLGFAGLAAGELTFYFQEIGANTPYGLPEALWSVGITLLAAGFVTRLAVLGIQPEVWHQAVALGVGFVGLLIVLALTVPGAAAENDIVAWAGPYNLAADVIVAAASLLILLTYSTSALLSRAWAWLLAGGILYVLADLAFFTLEAVGTTPDERNVLVAILVNAPYPGIYCIFLIGMLVQVHLDRGVIAERFKPARPSLPR